MIWIIDVAGLLGEVMVAPLDVVHVPVPAIAAFPERLVDVCESQND